MIAASIGRLGLAWQIARLNLTEPRSENGLRDVYKYRDSTLNQTWHPTLLNDTQTEHLVQTRTEHDAKLPGEYDKFFLISDEQFVALFRPIQVNGIARLKRSGHGCLVQNSGP